MLNANYCAPKVDTEEEHIFHLRDLSDTWIFFLPNFNIFYGIYKKNRFFTEKNRHGIIFFKRKEGRFYPKN